MSKFEIGDKVEFTEAYVLIGSNIKIGDKAKVITIYGGENYELEMEGSLKRYTVNSDSFKLSTPEGHREGSDSINVFQVGDEVEVVSVDGIDIMRGLKKGKKLTVGKPINKNIVYFKKSDYGLFPEQLKLVEPKQTHKDNINPSHYTQGKYETIDIILDRVENLPGDQATLVGNIIKYLWRYDKKNGVECLKKSEWYLNKLIEVMENGGVK